MSGFSSVLCRRSHRWFTGALLRAAPALPPTLRPLSSALCRYSPPRYGGSPPPFAGAFPSPSQALSFALRRRSPRAAPAGELSIQIAATVFAGLYRGLKERERFRRWIGSIQTDHAREKKRPGAAGDEGASETDHGRDPDPEKTTTRKSGKKKRHGGKA